MSLKNWIPDRKILGSGSSGVITFFITRFYNSRVEDIADKITVEEAGIITGGVMFVVGYFLPPSAKDKLKRLDKDLVDNFNDQGQNSGV